MQQTLSVRSEPEVTSHDFDQSGDELMTLCLRSWKVAVGARLVLKEEQGFMRKQYPFFYHREAFSGCVIKSFATNIFTQLAKRIGSKN